MAKPTGNGPSIAAVEVALPPHVYTQDEVVAGFTKFGGGVFARFSATSGVRTRHFALPLEQYFELSDFTAANDAFIEAALDLLERALLGACEQAGISPHEIDLVMTTSVTGVAAPSLEARLAQRVGLRPDVKRIPIFGLGCVAGAAGIARVSDYLRGFPDHTAVLLAVELCSLTVQNDDRSVANLVATSLFGDGAAAVILKAGDGPRVIDTRSHLYPDSQHVMGWQIGANGFKIVLSAEVPAMAERYLASDVDAFLESHNLQKHDIQSWVCHPGGPKVIEAIERVLELPPEALRHTRKSLSANGNLSSVSVLDVLRRTLPEPFERAVMMAMGPGFCSELVLLER